MTKKDLQKLFEALDRQSFDYAHLIREEMYRRQFFRDVMGPDLFPAITSERVTPAAVKGQDVEQQTEEGNVQLSTQIEGES